MHFFNITYSIWNLCRCDVDALKNLLEQSYEAAESFPKLWRDHSETPQVALHRAVQAASEQNRGRALSSKRSDCLATVDVLLDYDADEDSKIDGGKWPGMTPLHEAVEAGLTEFVQKLLDPGGAEPNARTDAGASGTGPFPRATESIRLW